jgi:hypothetical protein
LQRIKQRGKRCNEQKKGGSTLAQELYRIRDEGHLDQHWSNWLDGMTITHLENGETQLSGYLTDKAALHGVLHEIQNLGIPLIEVCRVPPNESLR